MKKLPSLAALGTGVLLAGRTASATPSTTMWAPSTPFVQGYGVDLGLLIDVVERVGISSVAQVDLGVRVHRNRSLDELGPQATAVLHTALARAGLPARPDSLPVLARPWREPEIVEVRERPPVAQLPARTARATLA